MKWPLTVALAAALLLALILRVPDLDQRPFHNDEAVNALKFQSLLDQGVYRYDPKEFHGPTLHYATLVLARTTAWPSFAESSEASFRWLNVLCGLSLIPTLWLLRDALGRAGVAWAAVLTAISPVMVFFSRDYIHEMLLVAFTFLFIGSVWRYSRSASWRWAVLTGVAAGLMHATKETFLLNFLAMGAAAGVLRFWQHADEQSARDWRRRLPKDAVLILGVWALVSLAFFSSFGQNLSGPLDSLRTYLPWSSRAGGESLHVHPWWFYAQRLFWQNSGTLLPWTELGVLLLALVGARAAFSQRGLGVASAGFVRWLAIYTGLLFVMYSFIPYKTPWCILGAAHGIVLLAGVGLAVLWRITWKLPYRVALTVGTFCLLAHTVWQAWAVSHAQVASSRNPWAYADTAPDMRNLIALVNQVAAASPHNTNMNVQVVCEQDDYWPLPYYLRGYPRAGWWSDLPPEPFAPVILVSPGVVEAFEANADYWNAGTFQLRHGVFRSCYVEKDLWQSFLTMRQSD